MQVPHIRKATLRLWREQFAACLREEGVAASAMADFRKLSEQDKAACRPPVESSFMRRKVEATGKELQSERLGGEPGKQRMASTRDKVFDDWAATAASLRRQG